MSRIITITGPSGSGKSTLEKALFPLENRLISFTTRPPRNGEVDGIDYYFLNDKNVAELEEAGALLEHVVYNGYQYGFTKDEVSSKLKEGDVSAVLNIDGVKAFINSEFKDDVYPFFLNVSLEKVKKNMETRDDTPENKEKRVSLFNQEIDNKSFLEQLKNSTVIDVEDMNVKELSFLFAELLH